MRAAWGLVGVLLCLDAAAKDLPPARPLDLLFVGGAHGDTRSPTLEKLKERLEKADPKSTVVVFTGNYLQGELPEKEDEGRAGAEVALRLHVDAVRDFFARGGRVYFLPGHHDFADGGTKAIKRLKRALNAELAKGLGLDDVAQKKRDVMPEGACANSTLLELSSVVSLLLVNSQWWMADSFDDPNFNDSCKVKSRTIFLQSITDAMRAHRDRRLVIASHHPLKSYGELGGGFTAEAHFEPFPVAGTLWVAARELGAVPQYQAFPLVAGYTQFVANEAGRYGAFVFVAGHDESLQLSQVGAQLQVVAGTSAREGRPVVTPSAGDFALGSPGWAEVQLNADGSGAARLFGPDGSERFSRVLPRPLALPNAASADPKPLPDGPVRATYSKRPVWKMPGVVKFFLGSYYAEAFQVSMPYDVLDLEAEGFSEPFKLGGGLQSNSVRVHDAQGGDWAIRSTTKDASRVLPFPVARIRALERVMEHGFTATHPEAALAVARLAEAAGILHTRPRLMYLPDQRALGRYRGFVGDEVVMLEQRPNELDDGHVVPAHLGGRDEKTRFKDYEETVDKLLEKPQKHRVDQEAMLRARLFDMLLGDWDRHLGQWRFAVDENEAGDKVYSPIPMDRDQALASYDGLGLAIARLLIPQARSTVPFTGDYGPLRWLNFNARDVDAVMLNRLEHDRWLEIAGALQAAITDAVIDAALSTWHQEAYALNGPHLAEALKLRRDKLLDVAEEFYRRQARGVDVTGSLEADRFVLTFADGGRVRVEVFPREEPVPFYVRTFRSDETDEVRLYALEGDDVLELRGKVHHDLCVRFIGGEGKDEVTAPDGPVDAKAVIIYDRPKGVRIDENARIDDARSDVAQLNQYNPTQNHEPDQASFMPGLQVNPDQGVFVGGTYTHTVPMYKTKPWVHSGTAYVATATLGVALEYQGLFPRSIDWLDQELGFSLRTPQYARNFYGFTNALVGLTEPRDRYRVRQALFQVRYGLSYSVGGRARVGGQLFASVIDTERTAGRYLETAGLPADTFGPRPFISGRLFAEANTYDSLTLPRRGLAGQVSVEGRYDLLSGRRFSANLKLAAAVAIPLDASQRFVVISRAGVEGILGPHLFYFAPTLGASQLRSYNLQQFTGELAFAHTTDLRIDLLRLESMLPGTVGIALSADHGRVWGAGIASDTYHFSYGGGVWWSIVDLIGVQVSYHRGLDDSQRVMAMVGPLFADLGF